MQIRNVLRTYTLLRQLSDDESALLETLRTLNDTERELLVESLGPVKPVGKKPGKKAASKKSPRASSLAEQIKGTGASKPPAAAAGVACIHTEFLGNGNNIVCAELEDHAIHDPTMGYAGYHEFQPAEQAAAAGEGSR